MSQRIRRRKAGRSRTSRVKKQRVEKRVHKITIALTTTEKKELEAKAKKLNVPRYLVQRWKVTDQPIPRPPAKRR